MPFDPSVLASLAGSLPGPQTLFGALGDMWNRQSQEAINEKNAAMQREFAQMGLQWRVADAKAAGIHPLAALGFSSPTSGNPYQVGDASSGPGEWIKRLGNDMGQSVSRAAQVGLQLKDRANTDLQNEYALEHMRLSNELLKSQISNINHVNGPVAPGTEVKLPAHNIVSATNSPSVQAGTSPSTKFVATGDGGLKIVMSDDFARSVQNDTLGTYDFQARNYFGPQLGWTQPVKPTLQEHPLPSGMDWQYSRSRGAWYPNTLSNIQYDNKDPINEIMNGRLMKNAREYKNASRSP